MAQPRVDATKEDGGRLGRKLTEAFSELLGIDIDNINLRLDQASGLPALIDVTRLITKKNANNSAQCVREFSRSTSTSCSPDVDTEQIMHLHLPGAGQKLRLSHGP
jgi:hypothetical protein